MPPFTLGSGPRELGGLGCLLGTEARGLVDCRQGAGGLVMWLNRQVSPMRHSGRRLVWGGHWDARILEPQDVWMVWEMCGKTLRKLGNPRVCGHHGER